MSKYIINSGLLSNKQNDLAYYNRFETVQDTGIIPLNNSNIRYNNTLIDQDNNLSTYINNEKPNNNSNSITIDWTPQSVRDFKYNILQDKFNAGYPKNYTYTFCDQKLSTVFNMGSKHYSVDQTVDTSYPRYQSISIVEDNINNPFLCGFTPPSCQSVICPSGQTFDPASCACVSPPLCIPQPSEPSCSPTILYATLKPLIKGYAWYLETPKQIEIPDIGVFTATCGGGHVCDATLFRPILVFPDSSILQANRNISLNNGQVNDPTGHTRIPVPGFVPLLGERSDTFDFVVDDPSTLDGARVELVCQSRYCHNGVTFIVLVAETLETNEPVVIFSTCLAPGPVKSKVIGYVDCPGSDPGPCDTPPVTSSPTPTPTITPTITTTATPTPTPTITSTATPTPTITSTATPTPTLTTTPTPTPSVPNNSVCCFCDYIADGSFTFHGPGPVIETQIWFDLVQACNITAEMLESTNTTTINCNGTQYEIEWTYSGVNNSFGGKIYDATILQV
jgi:hypothetical protein